MSARPLLAAHRGGAALWPENSLLAFRQALALGSDLLELDVHPTADGEVAVIHDPTLDRTTDATGAVARRTAAELARARLRGPDGALTDERVPLLDDVLGLVAPSRASLLVEVKGPEPDFGVRWERAAGGARPVPGPRYEGLEATVLAKLDRAGLAARAIVMAFNTDVVARVRALAPDRRVTLLVAARHVAEARARPEACVEWAVRLGATDLGLQHTQANAEVVRAARVAGLVLGVWTVNDEAAMRGLVELGVDMITSDRPDLLKRVLEAAS
jgi:glycerophosphoryl diester phosphodiesterase